MKKQLTIIERNEIAKINRKTFLNWNNLFWLFSLLLTGVIFMNKNIPELGWGYIAVHIEIVSLLLLSNTKIIKLSYFIISFIEPLIIALMILLIEAIINNFFLTRIRFQTYIIYMIKQ